jgi:hypothetical protein
MLRRLAPVRTDISEERIASIIKVTRIGELGTALAVTSNRRKLRFSETPVHTRATRRNIPEDGILHSHCRENLKSGFCSGEVMCFLLRYELDFISQNTTFFIVTAVKTSNLIRYFGSLISPSESDICSVSYSIPEGS